jgi:alpha-1,3-glucan synthase
MWLLGVMPLLLRAVLYFLGSILRKTVFSQFLLKLIVGGAPVTSWIYRACIIQGTQQIFAAGLWYWGHKLATQSAAGHLDPNKLTTSKTVTAVTWSGALLLLGIGVSLFIGLPDYYRQLPGRIPAFYKSLTRRKLVLVRFIPYKC